MEDCSGGVCKMEDCSGGVCIRWRTAVVVSVLMEDCSGGVCVDGGL